MHIPDNYLSPSTCAVMGAAVAPVWALSGRKLSKEFPKERIPLLGIGAALSFLIMMFNVPLPGGTTGHAVGATLLAVLLGPQAACISISVALLIQALVFGDGGILAFGANCFNMAFIAPFLGYFIYKFVKDRSRGPTGEFVGLAVAAYASLNVAAFFTAIEFGLQPYLFKNAAGLPLYCPYPLAISVPAMMLPHLAVAGIVEAAFTVAVFSFVKRASPDMIREDTRPKVKSLYALLVALACLSPLGLLAAGTAWGEWGIDEIAGVVSGGQSLGFVPGGMAGGVGFAAPIPDYALAGLPAILGYVLSAIAGTAALVIVFKLAGFLIAGRRDGAGASG
jgi:cobalt/nickel transport system permease protein